jgi:hypothetical protein
MQRHTILKDYGLSSGGRTHQEVKALLDEMDTFACQDQEAIER